jgi:hypothetical protein
MSDGFVYFIKEEESGNIKIGFSEKHPKGRLKDFQTGNSNKLILLGYIEGTYEDESNLHREFNEERIRKDNEWFKSSTRLKERIKELVEDAAEEKKRGIQDLNFNSGERKNLDSDVSYEGPFKGTFEYVSHKMNVKGTFFYPEGKKFELSFDKESPNGHGTYLFHDGVKYKGGLKNGYMHGQGTIYFPNGTGLMEANDTVSREWTERKHEGEFIRNLFHGHSIITNNDGCGMIISEWMDDDEGSKNISIMYDKEGFIKFNQNIEEYEIDSEGIRYIGESKDGKMHGLGTIIWPDGGKYIGEWKDGRICGLGALFNTNGYKYVGEFKDGEMHGLGTIFWDNGTRFQGELIDGKRQGFGRTFYENGLVKYEGKFYAGSANGLGKSFYEDGTPWYSGELKDDLFWNGTEYDKNGNIEEKYVNGKSMKQ